MTTWHNCAALVAAPVAKRIGRVLDLAGGVLRQSAHQLRHRVLGDVHAVVLDSTARPRLLDLQLPRRRQTSCPALLLVVFGEIEPGMLSSWIQFV